MQCDHQIALQEEIRIWMMWAFIDKNNKLWFNEKCCPSCIIKIIPNQYAIRITQGDIRKINEKKAPTQYMRQLLVRHHVIINQYCICLDASNFSNGSTSHILFNKCICYCSDVAILPNYWPFSHTTQVFSLLKRTWKNAPFLACIPLSLLWRYFVNDNKLVVL